MTRDDMALEISMRRDIPLEEVEEVLDEEEILVDEEKKCKKRKKFMMLTFTITLFMLGAAAAMYVLDRKQKIDMDELIKSYADKIAKKLDM